jgi:glycosyltransferase involved in cell wall biosynthesis
MLVSVYMPTCDRIDLLSTAVESVLAQTYCDVELIVVNDASDDGTEAYLTQRAKSDGRLVHLTNVTRLGAPASRNIAIRRAQGAFVTGLDDDDEFRPERVGAFVEYWNLLTSRGVRPSCLYAQDIWVDRGVPCLVTKKRSSVTANDLFEGNYIGNQIFAPKAHFLDAGLFDERLPAWQDFEFFMRVLQKCGTAHLLDMATYQFSVTLRPDRISAQEKRIRAAFEIVADKHARGLALKQKALFLQMFQEGYAISPGVADWLRFLQWGGWPKGYLRLLRSTIVLDRKYFPASG